MSWDNTTQRLDRETVRAMMCATAAAGIGYFLGCPRDAAKLATLSAACAAVLREVKLIDDQLKSLAHNDHTKQRMLETLIAVPITCFVAFKMGYGIPRDGYAAVGAGVAIGLVLWGEPKNPKSQKMPIVGYIAAGYVIGTLRPQWFSPLHGAALMGMVAAHPHAMDCLFSSDMANIQKLEFRSLISTATLFAMPWLAKHLGLPVNWDHFACAVVATKGVPALQSIFESRKEN